MTINLLFMLVFLIQILLISYIYPPQNYAKIYSTLAPLKKYKKDKLLTAY
jgi:hypothetical protein